MNPILKNNDTTYCYTRKQAIEDGILIDVTITAQEAGFNWPVANTSAVWYRYIVPFENLSDLEYGKQSRLWDVLVALLYAASRKSDTITYFKIPFLTISRKRIIVTLKAVAGFDDNGNSVITIMLPEED